MGWDDDFVGLWSPFLAYSQNWMMGKWPHIWWETARPWFPASIFPWTNPIWHLCDDRMRDNQRLEVGRPSISWGLNLKLGFVDTLQCHHTWLAGESSINGGFDRKITDFYDAMFDYQRGISTTPDKHWRFCKATYGIQHGDWTSSYKWCWMGNPLSIVDVTASHVWLPEGIYI